MTACVTTVVATTTGFSDTLTLSGVTTSIFLSTFSTGLLTTSAVKSIFSLVRGEVMTTGFDVVVGATVGATVT